MICSPTNELAVEISEGLDDEGIDHSRLLGRDFTDSMQNHLGKKGPCSASIDSAFESAEKLTEHAGLTPEGLNGMRLVICVGMLAAQSAWELRRMYQVPAELAATVECCQTTGMSPGQWVRNGGSELIHPMIAQQRMKVYLVWRSCYGVHQDYEEAPQPSGEPATNMCIAQETASFEVDGHPLRGMRAQARRRRWRGPTYH